MERLQVEKPVSSVFPPELLSNLIVPFSLLATVSLFLFTKLSRPIVIVHTDKPGLSFKSVSVSAVQHSPTYR